MIKELLKSFFSMNLVEKLHQNFQIDRENDKNCLLFICVCFRPHPLHKNALLSALGQRFARQTRQASADSKMVANLSLANPNHMTTQTAAKDVPLS